MSMSRETQAFVVAMTLIIGCFLLLVFQPRLGIESVALFGFATATITLVAGYYLGGAGRAAGMVQGAEVTREATAAGGASAGTTVVSDRTQVTGSPVRVEPQDREGG